MSDLMSHYARSLATTRFVATVVVAVMSAAITFMLMWSP